MSDDKIKFLNDILQKIVLFVLCFILFKIFVYISEISSISVMFNGINEARDYIKLRLVNYILNGINPYTLDTFYCHNVPYVFPHSAFYPIMVAIVCKLTNISIISGYYVVNILCVLITCLNVFLIVKNFFNTNLLKIIAFLCILINITSYFTIFGAPIFTFRSDVGGILVYSLFLLTVYKNKKQTLLLSILSVMFILTKQSFIVMAIPLLIFYLLTKEKILALKYVIQCIICGIITFVLIQIFFPMYWVETTYIISSLFKELGGLEYAIHNIFDFYLTYLAYSILILAGITGIIIIKKNNKIKNSFYSFFKDLIEKHEYATYLILNMFFGTIFLFILARGDIDGIKYCRGILGLSFLLLSIYIWHKYFADTIITPKREELKQTILILFLCIASVITYYRTTTDFRYTVDDIKTFINLDSDIAMHENEKIYLGMNTTQYMINRNLWDPDNIWFNDGQIKFIDRDIDNEIVNKYFYGEYIENAGKNYKKEVYEMIKNKEFGIIALCFMDYTYIDKDFLNEYYYPAKEYMVSSLNSGGAEVTVWYPRE